MRILLASDTFPPDINGAAVFTQRLAEGLVGRGHEVCNISPSPDRSSFVHEVHGVRVHRAPSIKFPSHHRFHIASPMWVDPFILRIFEEFGPEVVHSQSHFTIGRRSLRLAKLRGIPSVATNHFLPENLIALLPFELPEALNRLISQASWRDVRRVYSMASAVTAPTPHAIDILREHAGIYGVLPISCGIEGANYFRDPSRELRSASRNILFVGRLEKDKHVEELILATRRMPSAVTLRIVGSGGDEERLRCLAAGLGLNDRVVWLGNLSDNELRTEYGLADVFCMPGRAELQSIATLEALAASLPVVLADAGALPHLLSDGANGMLYPPGDVSALVFALEFVSDPSRHATLSQASKIEAEKHELSYTLDKFEQLYRRLTGYSPSL